MKRNKLQLNQFNGWGELLLKVLIWHFFGDTGSVPAPFIKSRRRFKSSGATTIKFYLILCVSGPQSADLVLRHLSIGIPLKN